MIIELLGLPGTGKTALAQAMKSRGAVLVSLPSRTRIVTDAFLFWLEHPVLASRLLAHLLKEAPRDSRYELFVNGYLGYAARYRKARSLSRQGSLVVLDQGFLQLIVSLHGLPEELLRKLPKPEVLVVLTVEPRERERRMAARGWAPRASSGTEKRLLWQEHAEKAVEAALPILSSLTRVFRYDGMVPPQEGALVVMEFAGDATVRATPVRNLLKTILAIVSLIVARVVGTFSRSTEAVVLMYHAIDRSGWKLAVSPEAFERQMRYLSEKKLTVSIADIVSYAKGTTGNTTFPVRAVAVTFDDGYRDLLTTVLPILEQYRIPATVFIPSNLSVRTDPSGRVRLTEEDVRMLAKSPLITIGSHARSHKKFTELSSEDMQSESKGSADELARMIGRRPRFFAYPFGARTQEAEQAVEAAGYEAAFGITEGTVRPGDALFRLKRVQIDGTMHFSLFRLRLTRAVDWNRRLVDSFRLSRCHKFFGLLSRLVRGEDILLVPQATEQWNRQFSSGTWDRLVRNQPNTTRIAEHVLERVRAKAGITRVLDVGCGNGGLAALIAKDPSIDYVGIDIAASAIDIAREASPQGTFIEANAAQAPHDLGIFDMLVFNEFLYYLDPRIVLANYRACADAQTYVYISIVRSWRSWFLWRRIRRFLRISRFESIPGYQGNQWDIAIGTFI